MRRWVKQGLPVPFAGAGTHGMVAPERDSAQAKGFVAPPEYRRHRPEATLLYQLVAEHYPSFRDRRVAEGRALPRYVEDEFEAYLKCGLLEHGFLLPRCGARRMVETAALLVDEVLPRQPIRQWVLSVPFALRYLLATRPEIVTQVLGIVWRAAGALARNGKGQALLQAALSLE